MNLNKAFILGRLTRDPEQRTMPSGKSISSFGVATNRIWTNQESGEKQEQVEFHNIVAFGKRADICNQYLTKGQLVLIEGRIQTRSWEDQSGNKRSRTDIIVDNMQMGPRAGGARREEVPETPEPVEEITIEETEPSSTEATKGNKEKPEKEEKKSSKKKPAKGESASGGKDNPEEDEEEIDVKDIPF
jgi:single-strand DNA-binding protein